MGEDTGDDVRERGIEREYRRRRPLPKAVLGVLAFYLVIAVRGTFQAFSSPRPDAVVPAWLVATGSVALWVLLTRLVLSEWRARTVVTADGVTVRGAVRTRTRTWHGVHDIRVEPYARDTYGLTPRLLTYLYDTDGRRILLPRFDERQLDDPCAEVADLREAAARHRGRSWEPRPEAEARVRWRAGHRKAWQRANLGAAVVLAAMFALWVWQELFGTAPFRPLTLLVCVPLASLGALAALLHGHWQFRAVRRRG